MANYHDALVSIITPAFNASQYIGQTIRSVRAQTYSQWEWIVVDDCSKDDTFAILQRAARKDERIRPIRHLENSGPSKARNTALDAARGRYVAFLDADDLWLPEKLERQLEFLRSADAAFTYTQFRRIRESEESTGRLVTIPERLDYTQLLKNTAIATSTVLLDRERTGAIRMVDTYYDDLVLWLSLLKQGLPARGLPEDLMRYRVLPGSVSRGKLNSARWVWHTYREIEGLGLPAAVWYFAHYAWNGLRKYRRF